MTNRLGADYYIAVRYRSELSDTASSTQTFHFPGSTRGRALATDIGAALARATGDSLRQPLEAVTYPLQQTACPAIIVQPPSIGRIDEELRLSNRGTNVSRRTRFSAGLRVTRCRHGRRSSCRSYTGLVARIPTRRRSAPRYGVQLARHRR